MRAHSASIASILPEWMTAPVMPLRVAKELRVLAPVSMLGVVAIALSCLAPEDLRLMVVLLAYAVSCAAIGSMAAGHDFLYRTTTAFLALPIRREEIWRNRMFLAFAAMLPLSVAIGVMVTLPIMARGGVVFWQNVMWSHFWIIAPPLCSAMFLAPWLTLVSRSVLFGTVGCLALPYLLSAATNLISSIQGVGEIAPVPVPVMMLLMPTLWLAGGILGRRKFMTLEAIESGFTPAAQSRRGTARALPSRRQNAFVSLLEKELYLQKVPLTFTFCSMAIALALKAEDLPLWTMVYAAICPVLFGGVASADERQLGVAEWQMLMPVAARKQWLVKVVVTLSLSAFCSGILPVTLFHWMGRERDLGSGDFWQLASLLASLATMLSAVSLYVSSLCGNSLKAVLIGLPAGLAVVTGSVRYSMIYIEAIEHERGIGTFLGTPLGWPLFAVLIGFVIVLLRFALMNHRLAERGADRIVRQLIWVSVYAIMATAGLFSFLWTYVY